MVAALAGGVPVKGAPVSPGVQTPWKQAHHGSPSQHPAALVHSRAVHRGKRPSAPSQSYRRGGGHAAAAATVLYHRRRGSVSRTVSHDNYDYRCRTAAADPYGYRSRCYYRCRSHRRRHSHERHYSRCHQSGERRRREQRERGGLQGRQRREHAGQAGFECSNASDGRTGHRCRRSLRISTVPCRSWPRGPFARTVHSGAPSRRARAAIPLGATLRRWYRRRMAPRDQNSPPAVLTANGGAVVAAGGGYDGCLHRETRTAVIRVHFRSTYHLLSAVLHTLHGQQARVGWASPLMSTAIRAGASCGWPRRHGQYAPRLGAGEEESQAGSAYRSRSDRKDCGRGC